MGKYDGNNNRLLKLIAQFAAPQGSHHRIHDGEMFSAGVIVSALADDASADIVIRANTTQAHLVLQVAATGNAEIHFFESPVFTNVGAQLTPADKNRITANEALTEVFSISSTTSNGTELNGGMVLPGGTKGGGSGGVNVTQREGEWVLAPSTDYLLKVFNHSGGAQDVSIGAMWYEPSADQ